MRGVMSSAIYGYVDLEFCIIPHHVPVYIQAITLKYKGDWFEGERNSSARRDNILEFGDHELIGTQITTKAITPFYFVWFELPVPVGSISQTIEAVLVIESERRPCESCLGILKLNNIFA